jgi:hypothetical protein
MKLHKKKSNEQILLSEFELYEFVDILNSGGSELYVRCGGGDLETWRKQ